MQKTEFTKRFLAILLCLVMIFSTVPTTAFAAEITENSTTQEENVAPSAKTIEVSPEHQLSELYFKNSFTQESSFYEMQPAFDSEIKEHNVIIPDTVNPSQNFAIWATLSETASGDITVQYVKHDGKQAPEYPITSGDEYGTSLSKPFKQNSLIGNSLTFRVGGEEAYIVNIIRKATLKGLTLSDQTGAAIELSSTFDGSIYSYSAEIPSDAVLSITATATASEANVSVNGSILEENSITVTPEWSADKTATITITVAGGTAQSSTYTIELTQKGAAIDRIEIVTPPIKTIYQAGEEFDITGLSVKAVYIDGSSRIIDNSKLSFVPDTPLAAGTNKIEISYKGVKTYQPITVLSNLVGSGTSSDPYLISSVEDMVSIRTQVSQGNNFKGCYFEITANLVFPADWIPIGCLKAGALSTENGVNILPFSGSIDGKGHTLTFASGSKPLFNYVREASVSNFNIVAPFMDGYALVDKYTVDYGEDGNYAEGTGGSYQEGCPDTITISNVTIKSGSIIKNGGFIGGFASGGNTVTVVDCLVEKNVKIGCNADGTSADNSCVGSFGGMVSGVFRNCVSYADVYGSKYVGGIAGYKGQSMGLFNIIGCEFHGNVIASGSYAGGIVGAGYSASSAPNTMCVTIEACKCDGTVTGADYVGGILGAESAIQCWSNGIGIIRNNSFTGTIHSSGENVGGVIGYMASLNRYTIVENNFYSCTPNNVEGVGKIKYIDTSCTTRETASDTTYFDTSKELPNISGVALKSHNREDDPLGADKTKLFYTGEIAEKYVTELLISGNYKTEYYVGDSFDTDGIQFEARWSNGEITYPSLTEIAFFGFNSLDVGTNGITAKYENTSCIFTISVMPKSGKITVNITILGDSKHGETDDPHGLAMGGLSEWAYELDFEANANETVWDVLQRVFEKYNMYVDANDDNAYGTIYIKSINGLREKDNGEGSGWMYTVNGVYPNVGVAATFVKEGDEIILHYTDDYTKEDGSMSPDYDATAKAVDELIENIGTISYTDACKERIDAARKAYDALSASDKKKVTKLSVLETAEKDYANLKQAQDNLDKAVDDLNKAITDGDAALDKKIADLTAALENAKKAFEATDAADKADLEAKIATAQTTLQGAIDKVASDLEAAKTELSKAITDGDAALDQKIADLTAALENAKKAFEATDAANKAELEGKITAAQTALQSAIDKVASDLADAKTALEAKGAELEAKDAEQQTFITVVCVIACVSLAGNIATILVVLLLKRKRTN